MWRGGEEWDFQNGSRAHGGRHRKYSVGETKLTGEEDGLKPSSRKAIDRSIQM